MDKLEVECWAFVSPGGHITASTEFETAHDAWAAGVMSPSEAEIELARAFGARVIRVKITEVDQSC